MCKLRTCNNQPQELQEVEPDLEMTDSEDELDD